MLSSKETIDLLKLKTGNEVPYSRALVQGPINTKLKIEATTAEEAALEEGGTDEPGEEVETALVKPDTDGAESAYLPATRDGTGETS